MRPALLSAVLLLAGCGSDSVTLVVDLRTDLIAVQEWRDATVTVMPGSDRFHAAVTDADYFGGVQVANVTGLAPGEHSVTLGLNGPAGRSLVAQRMIVDLSTDTAITMVVTRGCRDVSCAPDQYCLAAACVSDQCSDLNPDACSAPDCTADAECAASVACAQGRCVEGRCLVAPADGRCDAADRCDPDVGCVPRDDRVLSVSVPGGTDIPIGTEVPLVLTAEGAWDPAAVVTLTVDSAELVTATMRGPSVSFSATRDAVSLAVPLDTPVGTLITLTSDAPRLEGDALFSVVETRLMTQNVDGRDYQVAEGFALDAPLFIDGADRMVMTDRVNQIAFAPPGSQFGPEPYLSLTGDTSMGPPVEIAQVLAGRLQVFATSDGVNGPDAGFTQIAFADPSTAWGDLLYVCSTSVGGGDGIFTVDPMGSFQPFWVFNNCNGMAFDGAMALGSPGFATPMYVNENSEDFLRVDPSGAPTVLVTAPFPFNGNGFKVHVPTEAPWAGWLYMVSERDGAGMGRVWRVDPVEPWGMPEMFLDGLPSPPNGGVVFTYGGSLGARMYMALRDDNALRAFRPDGTASDIVTGFTRIEGLTVRGEEVWIVDRGAGQILRLTRPR